MNATSTRRSPARFNWKEAFWPHSLSARGLILRGVMAVAFFAIAHACGLRDYVMVVSGTSPTGAPLDARMALLGGLYILAWMGLIVAAPIMILAGTILLPIERHERRS